MPSGWTCTRDRVRFLPLVLFCLQGENDTVRMRRVFKVCYITLIKLLMYWWMTYSEQLRWDKWWKKKDKFFERKIVYNIDYTLESPLDSKELKPVNPKGNQPWIFIGRTDTEAPILWPPHANSQLIGKDSDAGKGWRQEEKGTAEDEMCFG